MTSTNTTSGRGTEASELLSMWEEVAQGLTERLAAVGPGSWTVPTCCEGWDVAELVGHAIGGQRLIPRCLGASGAIDATNDEPVLLWGAVRQAANSAFRVPGAMDDVIEFFGDEMPAMNGLRFMLGDLLVHTWDLARATGHNDRLHREACALVLANLEPMDEFLRTSGMYGPKLEPATGADTQDRLLAFLGRKV
jgi:uncharacterized protein (TIGR03086 family)